MFRKSVVLKSQIWDLNLVLNLYKQSKFIVVRRQIWSIIFQLRSLPSVWQLDSLSLPDDYIETQLVLIRKELSKVNVPDKLELERKHFWELWRSIPRWRVLKIEIDDRDRWS